MENRFILLLWKNYVLQKRHKIQTIFEIFLPVIFAMLLVIIRLIASSDVIKEPTYYPSFAPGFPHILSNSGIKKASLVFYAPKNLAVESLMDSILRTRFDFDEWMGIGPYEFEAFETEDDLIETYADDADKSKKLFAAVVFEGEFSATDNELPTNFTYKIRFPSKHRTNDAGEGWESTMVYPYFQALGPRNSEDPLGGEPFYVMEGFTYLQHAVEEAILRKANGTSDTDTFSYDVDLRRYPYPPYIDDVFLIALQSWLPLILLLSYIYPCINIAKSMVHEKEKRLKESMKIMGLPNYMHLAAWYVKSFLFMLISSIFVTALIMIKFFDSGETAVITYGDGTLIFVFLLVFNLTVISFSFLVSTLFSTANSAATAAGVLFFLTYFPYFFLQPRYYEITKMAKLLISLLSNTGMAFGGQIIAMFEGSGNGVGWGRLSEGASPDDTITFLDIIIILLIDALIYFLIGIYIEGVRPGEFGVPLPWYFPFTKSYWAGPAKSSNSAPVVTATASSAAKQEFLESEPKNTKAGIQIKGLTKIFGKKTAVNGMNLNMYDGQVTALLGHNGAGKTTTMSMLTGLFPPTSGTALVNGFDIRTDINLVRGSIGLCPQHDVLFDELTCAEHIRFFAKMKGLPEPKIEEEITRLLKALNLEPKRDAQAQTLSGGMKRKLCVAISFCGGSKIVLLDEPTSGMDPGARRSTWDLITQEKKGRTVILSTHFMEEADLLGDRIAIMASGTVQCVGSSLFLKKKYGGGYHLTIVKEPQCDINRIDHVIRRSIPDAELDQNVGAELSYSLPESKSHLFPDMFEELEAKKSELGIGSYGASITTMEEVFMKVGRIAEAEEHGLNPSDKPKSHVTIETLNANSQQYKLYDQEVKNTGFALLAQQLRAMMVKKMLYAVRNRILLVFQTIIPIAFLLMTLVLVQTLPGPADPDAFEMDLSRYKISGTAETAISCTDRPDLPQGICDAYKNHAATQGHVVDVKDKNSSWSFEDFVLDESNKNLASFNYRYIVGFEMNQTDASDPFERPTAFFNNQPFHAMPLALNFMTNAYRNAMLGSTSADIKLMNQPLPRTLQDKADDATGFTSDGFQIGFNMAFGMSFLAASFVVFLIKERETKAKHLQYVSGVKFPMFWAANFFLDFINYIIPCIIMMILIIAFQTDDLKSAEVQGWLFFLFVFYGFATLPLMYLFSFAFSIPSTGFTRMVFLNLVSGMAGILTITILEIPSLDLKHIADALDWIFMLFPQYNLGMGIILMSGNSVLKKICPTILQGAWIGFGDTCEINRNGTLVGNRCCDQYDIGYGAWEKSGIGRNLLFLFLIGFVSFAILAIAEGKVFEMIRFRKRNQTAKPAAPVPTLNNNSSKSNTAGFSSNPAGLGNPADLEAEAIEDSDVVAESNRIRNTNLTQLCKSENLIMRDLSKYYGKFLAVDQLCLGVQRGECFGLLGVNGAGKTTTFKMLTGDHPVSSGDAFVYSKSVKSDIKEVQKNLGYCPQFDALIEELTGRETLTLFARLRGVQEQRIQPLVDKLAANLLFTEHIDKRCGAYSGGNKRKLSTAIALVGNPPLVFLDEPTTGMDPVARRHLWNAISQIRDEGASIVLTSHSMEECEALCTRLSIMVNGKFRCLGSAQHLKTKFGEGYTLIAQISTKEGVVGKITRQTSESGRRRSSTHGNINAQPWERQLQPLRDYIQDVFPGAVLKDLHPGYVQYHIATDARVTWGQMFRKMEVAKAKFGLEAYSVGQTSLEQVFLNFTKAQVDYDD